MTMTRRPRIDPRPLNDHLTVSIAQLAQTDPADWQLVRGKLTTIDLGVYAGRSIRHGIRRTFSSKWPHSMCSRAGGKTTGRTDEIDCVFCLAILAREAALCCVCSIRWICGCRCGCHAKGAPRSK